jgi:phosphate:Na+ symporter
LTDFIFQLLGGIGLFLLGMVLLTDGLKAFAGESLRQALVKFTGTPVKAFLSGAFVTVLVQSSSATTVTVIGFVSAGLLTFSQALGVVLGASLGTTGTGWIIAGLGLKVSIGFYALPVVGVGALLRLLARGRLRSLGLALAGFGLIFIGIQTLQDGMGGFALRFNLADLPTTGIWGYVLAALVGMVLTVLMQSSSAAVATTLTALHAGAISFPHSAAIVIGAAIGTTVTGALAAIGGTTSAKRTALAHVGFNLATGILALILLPFFLALIRWAQNTLGLEPGALSLAAFHTLFISLGVILVLPFVGKLANMIERVLPERGSVFTRHLDPTLYSAPEVAVEAANRSLREIASHTFREMGFCIAPLRQVRGHDSGSPESLQQALAEVQLFLQGIPLRDGSEALGHQRVDAFHAIEHLGRMQSRLSPPTSIRHTSESADLAEPFTWLRECLDAGISYLESSDPQLRDTLRLQAARLVEFRRHDRPLVMRLTAEGKLSSQQGLDRLDAVRWLDRIAYHTWRVCEHLAGNDQNS